MAAHVVTHRTDSAEATEGVAAELATSLRGGECIAMYGELGAGKTQFVRGLVRGLNGPVRRVSSPTFVLLNVYDGGRLNVYHLDAYRVGGQDFEAIGFAELLEQPGAVVAVEWAERIGDLLPVTRINVRIESVDEFRRAIRIERAEA
jgi:tRNA threonylcarbamoyladenosine biosynthesis protein TsaE